MENLHELKKAMDAKLTSLEVSIECGKPQSEILAIYKELKELKYRMIQAQLKDKSSAEESTPI